jgi:hypothetical protein
MRLLLIFSLCQIYSTAFATNQEGVESINHTVPTAAEEPAQSAAVAAPQPPGSEIMLFDYQLNIQGDYVLSNGKNITQSPGYDSQPRFSADGQTIYYTHFVDKQMDIYQYNLSSGITSVYMTTEESEYSPTPMPDESGLSVVQVDANGDQYVVLLNNEADKEKQARRYTDLKQVGYFNWTEDQQLWSFVLNDEGGDLYHLDSNKQATLLGKNIGRSFITDATNTLLFYVDKNTTPWCIKSKQSKSDEAIDIMALPDGVEDFTLDAAGRFWTSQNNTLLVSTEQKTWHKVKEFELKNLSQISRLTTNPAGNQIAIVFAETNNKE